MNVVRAFQAVTPGRTCLAQTFDLGGLECALQPAALRQDLMAWWACDGVLNVWTFLHFIEFVDVCTFAKGLLHLRLLAAFAVCPNIIIDSKRANSA